MRGGDEGLPQGVLQLLIALQEDLLEDRELRGLCCPRLQPQEARRRGRGRIVGVWADLPEHLDGEEGVGDEGEPAIIGILLAGRDGLGEGGWGDDCGQLEGSAVV